MCIRIRDEGTGDTITRRVPGQGWNEAGVLGSYRFALSFIYDIDADGMGVTIIGDAWRERVGTGWLSIRVDAGTNTSVPAGSGSLWLDGWATAVSGATTGGGSGFRHSSGDVQFVGFPQVVDLGTNGAESFHGDIAEIPINHEQSVAVTNTTGLWVSEIGDQIHVPGGTIAGAIEPTVEAARFWESRTVVPERFVYELAGTVLAGGDKPLTLAASISSTRTENLLHLETIDPSVFPPEVTDHGVLASGFVFDIDACMYEVNKAIIPFIWWEDSGPNVWVADYADGDVVVNRIESTVGDDYVWSRCLKTADGTFIAAQNHSQRSIHVFERVVVDEYEQVATLDHTDFGGYPAPAWSGVANGSAGSLETFGPGEGHDAIIATGLEDGTLVAAQFRTDLMEVTGILNVGPADGFTSSDIVYFADLPLPRGRASFNWTLDGEAKVSSWNLDDGPESAWTYKVGEMDPGLFYDYQYIGGFGRADGSNNVVADKSWQTGSPDDLKATVSELWSYPFGGVGGPVDLFPSQDSEYEGFALGGGASLRLGMLKRAPEAADASVPAVARVQGAGAFFTSLMHIANTGGGEIDMEISYTPRKGSGGTAEVVTHTVPAGKMQTIEDPLETLFGLGGGAGHVGSLQVETTSGAAADLMLQTVVFARLDTGEEYGQFFPAMRRTDAIRGGQKAYLNTTEDPAHNRVNIGLMGAVDGTRFRVTPVDPLGTALAPPMTAILDSGDNTQINNLHSSFGLGSAADVVVEVEVVSGLGFAYASVLDGSGGYGGTSDPTTILPVQDGSNKVTLLEIGSIQGLNEFSGSASITNYSNRSSIVRADFFQRDIAGVTASETISIPAGDTVGYTDLGAELFGVSGDVGTVVLTATNGTMIGATGREFAIFRDGGDIVGTAGQLIAGQTDEDRLNPGTTYHFIGLRQKGGGSGRERSHFAVFNPATTDANVTVRLYDGASGAFEGERTWVVPSATLIQVNNVIREINPDHDAAEKRIEVEVNRKVFMNAFRVNPWGDPVTLSPFAR
jgi:hypothetical protein